MIAAFDLSLTQPGWATATTTGIRSGANVTPKAWGIGGRRLSMLRADLLGTIVEPCELVVIEDIPMHAKSAGLTAQLHGVVKAAVVDAGIAEPVLVPPATLKVFATGKGNADKVQMVVAARDRLGYAGTNDNEADALWLLQIGLRLAGDERAVALPQTHLRALDRLAVAS